MSSIPHLSVAAELQDRAIRSSVPIDSDAFFVSEVVDSFAHFGLVRVGVAGSGPILGIPLSEAGNGVVGPRKIGAAYPPHTQVLCYRPSGAFFCYVLGSIPAPTRSAVHNLVPDWIVPGCRSGMGFDRVHFGALIRPNGPSGEFNCAAGRPADELPGDHGYINEFGVGYGIGRVMAWLRAGHFCGVEAHFLDGLLRLSGHNLELATDGSELRVYNDEGEWSSIGQWNPYPWETMGRKAPETDFTRTGGQEWRAPEAGREPLFNDQMGLWRVQRFRGYLGDLEKTFVSAPTAADIGGDVARLSHETILPGLADIGLSADGRYHVRSAKGILLEKTSAIPIPKEMTLPADPTGDSADNYKSAGKWGAGDEHTRPDEPDDDFAGVRALMAHERHALLRYAAMQTVLRHGNDWRVPNDSDAVEALGLSSNAYDPDGNINPVEFWLPLPKAVTLPVDHRGSAKYYAGRALIELTDDGGVLIEDAFGSQIRMEYGNIIIAPRYDVVLQPGRNAQVWSPHDTIIKAGNSVDVSASLKDVRIKAEGNMMLRSSTRGILIESGFDPSAHGPESPDWTPVGEAVESRGVVIRAEQSAVNVYGDDVYVRSGVKEGRESSGQLHVDAGGGAGSLFLHGREVTSRADARVQFIVGSDTQKDNLASLDMTPFSLLIGGSALGRVTFGAASVTFASDSNDAAVNVVGRLTCGELWSSGQGIFGESVRIDGSLVTQQAIHVGGGAVFTGVILCANIAADYSSGFLASTSDEFRASENPPPEHPSLANDLIDSERERSRADLIAAAADDLSQVEEVVIDLYGDDSLLASPSLLQRATFSFRTPEEYGAVGLVWCESRWQQVERVRGNMAVWIESSVSNVDGVETMPYPGLEEWRRGGAFVVAPDGKLVDAKTGLMRDWSEVAADPTLPQASPSSFERGYVVVMQRNEDVQAQP